MSQHSATEQDFIKTLVIQDILLMNSEHNVYNLHNNQELVIDFKKESDFGLIVENDFIIFELAIGLDILDESTPDSLLLSSKAKFAGVYSYDKNNLSDTDIEKFSKTFFQYAAITHIMAFCREHFSSILVKSGYPRIILPLINLLDEDAQKEASKQLEKKAKES